MKELARLRDRGWTPEMVAKAWRSQKGRCGICKKPLPSPNKAYADHDHETGKPRALLCAACNTFEGYLRKRGLAFVKKVLAYVARYRAEA